MVAMKDRKERRSCCAFLSVLLLEILAWALAVVAITTSFWLAPTRNAVPGLSHAGLWLACGVPPAAPPPPPASELSAATATIASSIKTVKRDVAFTFSNTDTDGCTNSREVFADLNGGDYRTSLSVVRILAVAFLGIGFLKVLCALGAQCTRRASSQRGSGCLASTVSVLQQAVGWAAWGLFAAVAIQAADAGGRSVAAVWGWSFWVFTAALCSAALGGAALCCA